MVEKLMKAVIATGMAAGIVFAGGCLTRPVVSESPTTKTSFQAQVKQQSIDKVDLLFAIDNSASMGDKQDLLAAAVPVLVNRLLNPNCVDTTTTDVCKVAGDCTGKLGATAQCDVTGNSGAGQCFVPGDGNKCTTIMGTKPEFDAVHDMHIGLVSSSLGGGGSPDICVVSGSDTTHQDDKGHLLNRTLTNPGPPPVEGTINNAKPTDGNGGNFLAWLPASDPKNAGKMPPNVTVYSDGQANQLVTDFQSLVEGVQQHGCGLEAQLESWYHFLIQPDPWDSIDLDTSNPPKAVLNGVDATLLKMRHDFLRPDSLVAIIQLTDEEDSWSDPLWLGGYGWTARTQNFPGGPGQGAGPIGTTECLNPVNVNTNPPSDGPNNPDCTSCAFPGSNKPVSGTPIGADPNCQACAGGVATCPQKGWYTPAAPSVPLSGGPGSAPLGSFGAADGVNVRYSRQIMRAKYGFDNQHNYNRYVDGLRSPLVPDRNNESHDSSNYAPNRNCVNPLFAETLPDGSDTSPGALCMLTPGSRTPDLVFYAIIGGVPSQLLTDTNGNFKLNLTDADWTLILGKDPDHYVFDGIDPHMIQSTAPRQGFPQPPTGAYNLGTDPDNGREWNTLDSTAAIDLQYACTFDLPTPKDCTAAVNQNACDCTGTAASAPDGPPLCSTATRTTQIKGKAYPQSRYQLVAKALGTQAVVASLCATNVTPPTDSPSYGYNGAMQAIVNRLKNALSGQCLPQSLQPASDGTIPCLILVEYLSQTNQAAGCTDLGMSQPAPDVLQRFDANYIASLGDAGVGVTPPVICVFNQLKQGTDYQGATCEGSASQGWCYVSGSANTGGCPQAIKFGGSGPPAGTTIDLECIEAQGDGG